MPESRHYCPHCEEKVSLSTIHRHRQLYYDTSTHTWTKQKQISDSEDEQVNDLVSPYESSAEGNLSLHIARGQDCCLASYRVYVWSYTLLKEFE